MLRRLLHHHIDTEAASMGVPMTFMHHLADVSLPATLKFALFMPLVRHRTACPPAPYHVARLATARIEDCGSCVQIELKQARQADVPLDVLRAVMEDRPDDLPPPLADAHAFARAVATHRDEPDVRERLQAAFGDEAVAELALAIAVARFFPTVKRALGYATACTPLDLDEAPGAAPPAAVTS